LLLDRHDGDGNVNDGEDGEHQLEVGNETNVDDDKTGSSDVPLDSEMVATSEKETGDDETISVGHTNEVDASREDDDSAALVSDHLQLKSSNSAKDEVNTVKYAEEDTGALEGQVSDDKAAVTSEETKIESARDIKPNEMDGQSAEETVSAPDASKDDDEIFTEYSDSQGESEDTVAATNNQEETAAASDISNQDADPGSAPIDTDLQPLHTSDERSQHEQADARIHSEFVDDTYYSDEERSSEADGAVESERHINAVDDAQPIMDHETPQYTEPPDASTSNTPDVVDTHAESSDRITINYDEITPPISKDEDANREFVTGLDEIDKFFESVSPPDELDVGADGSSMQDVLVGQGLKIIFKRAKSFGSSVKERFEKIVEKALPQQLVHLARDEEEEEESLEDILKMMKGDLPLNTKSEKVDASEAKGRGVNAEEGVEDDKLANRFPLLKKPRVNKIYKYARRKWRQAKHLLDDLLSIFGGDDDEEDVDFSADFGSMNFDDVRSLLIEKNRVKVKEGGEMPQFGSEVDDSFVRSRYDTMRKAEGAS
jgi:hypothetical protein